MQTICFYNNLCIESNFITKLDFWNKNFVLYTKYSSVLAKKLGLKTNHINSTIINSK